MSGRTTGSKKQLNCLTKEFIQQHQMFQDRCAQKNNDISSDVAGVISCQQGHQKERYQHCTGYSTICVTCIHNQRKLYERLKQIVEQRIKQEEERFARIKERLDRIQAVVNENEERIERLQEVLQEMISTKDIGEIKRLAREYDELIKLVKNADEILATL